MKQRFVNDAERLIFFTTPPQPPANVGVTFRKLTVVPDRNLMPRRSDTQALGQTADRPNNS